MLCFWSEVSLLSSNGIQNLAAPNWISISGINRIDAVELFQIRNVCACCWLSDKPSITATTKDINNELQVTNYFGHKLQNLFFFIKLLVDRPLYFEPFQSYRKKFNMKEYMHVHTYKIALFYLTLSHFCSFSIVHVFFSFSWIHEWM